MQTQHNIFLSPDDVIEAGQAQGEPYLRIRPADQSYGNVTIFLGGTHGFGRREAIVGELRALLAAVNEAARPYHELTESFLAVDDPTDDPTDEPIADPADATPSDLADGWATRPTLVRPAPQLVYDEHDPLYRV